MIVSRETELLLRSQSLSYSAVDRRELALFAIREYFDTAGEFVHRVRALQLILFLVQNAPAAAMYWSQPVHMERIINLATAEYDGQYDDEQMYERKNYLLPFDSFLLCSRSETQAKARQCKPSTNLATTTMYLS